MHAETHNRALRPGDLESLPGNETYDIALATLASSPLKIVRFTAPFGNFCIAQKPLFQFLGIGEVLKDRFRRRFDELPLHRVQSLCFRVYQIGQILSMDPISASEKNGIIKFALP